MACKLGLQDVSYDPELHTGEVDFDFFDSIDSAVNVSQANANGPTKEESATRRSLLNDGNVTIPEESVNQATLGYTTSNTRAAPEGHSKLEFSRDKEPDLNLVSDELSSHGASGTDNEEDYERDPGTESEPDSQRDPGTESEAESSADNRSDSAPCSPGSERLQGVVRDVTAIQESLHRLRLSAGTSRTSQRNTDPVPAPLRGSAESGARVRRPRPRSGWPQRKRWSSSLAEAALTQRQISQLLCAESDSSSSDMVGVSDSESDSGAVGSAEVETWLGGAAGSEVGSAARSGVSARPARSVRSQADRPVLDAGRGPAPALPNGRSAPTGRLGLLADAVRHLDRAKSRTAPPAPRRPVRAPHRKNMSFTNEEVRQIDRNNRILLNKIVSQQRRPPARPTPLLGGGRSRGTQDQMRRENMILLQKIRTARPSRSVISGFHETPPPVRPILERGAVRHRPPWVDR